MLGLDARAARVTWTVALFCLCAWLLYQARHTIFLFIVALFFAYMLSPMVNFLHRYTPRRIPKTLSLVVVYVVLIAVLVVIGMQLGPKIAEQAASLSKTAPDLLTQQQIAPPAFVPDWLKPYWDNIIAGARDRIREGAQQALPILQAIGSHAGAVASSALLVVLVPILSFFFLKDSHDLYVRINTVLEGNKHAAFVRTILDDIDFVIAKYMRALVLLSICCFIAYIIAFTIIGVPFGALLAAIAAPLEFIPVLGPAIAYVSIIVVCLFTKFNSMIWLIAFLLIYRLFQDYMLSPYLMSEGVELHPLVVIFGVLAGDQIAGVEGMFLSVPILAAVRVVFKRMRGENPKA